MAHKIENLRLKNSNGEQLTYTTIIFMNEEEFEETKAKTTVRSDGGPAFGQYYEIMNGLFGEYIGEDDFLSYAKPLITGLASNANILTISNNMAYAFASALPQIFEPFGPYKAGDTNNEFILNRHRYAFFGGRGTNEAGAYTLASSFYRYTNPIPDTASKVVLANTGITAQQQQGSTIFAYFLHCKVSDLDDPWHTIQDYGVLKLCLYYGGSQSSVVGKRLEINSTGGATADNATHDAFIADLMGTDPGDHFLPGEEEDPYKPGGTSTTGGGRGTYDGSSDSIGIPGLPTLSATDTGFITIYNPELTEIKSLAAYMWNADIQTLEFWRKLVADPIDLILGFNIVPVAVPNGGRQTVKVGFVDTGVTMTKAATQYVVVDCGTLTINEFWGSALDYEPYTKILINLPFIGSKELSPSEVVGKEIHVVYHVDILSGSLICFIKCGDSVLYQFLGQCAQNIPLNSANYASMLSAAIGIAGTAAGIVSGGLSAPITGEAVGQIAQNVAGAKLNIPHSGAISGPGAQLGIMKPYLEIFRPRQSLADSFNTFSGYPSNITETLGNLRGFTSVELVHLHDIPATDAEKDEIMQLLQEGVIL